MLINPASNSVTYSIANLADVELALDSIERQVLNDASAGGQLARGCCGELNQIRDLLGLKRGTQRHEKFKQG